MTQFIKYIHVEKMTSEEVQGLLDEPCYILPKLDGANASIWHDGTKVCCGSRNHELNEHDTLQGFYGYVQQNISKFENFFKRYRNAIIYGEWLVPHTIKDYPEDAWRKFYAFDVMSLCERSDTWNNEKEMIFWSHNIVPMILNNFGIDVIPAIGTTSIYTPEEALDQCTWLLQEGKKHEGVVIKRDNFVNKFGRFTYGKYVPICLKELGKERKGKKLKAYEGGIETAIIHDFLTNHLIDKEIAKIKLERGFETMDPKIIGESLGKVWHAFITEEIWDILKKTKNPKIDFSALRKLCDQKVKEKFGI